MTDWRLYDTFYTERYLGDPGEEPDGYARNSLLADAPATSADLRGAAPLRLERPLRKRWKRLS